MTQSDLSTVVSGGDLRRSLQAMRDLLARDADDVTWEKHKAECKCVCGMADTRARVAVVKELRAVLDAIEALPEVKEESSLDRISAGVADIADARKHRRLAVADGP